MMSRGTDFQGPIVGLLVMLVSSGVLAADGASSNDLLLGVGVSVPPLVPNVRFVHGDSTYAQWGMDYSTNVVLSHHWWNLGSQIGVMISDGSTNVSLIYSELLFGNTIIRSGKMRIGTQAGIGYGIGFLSKGDSVALATGTGYIVDMGILANFYSPVPRSPYYPSWISRFSPTRILIGGGWRSARTPFRYDKEYLEGAIDQSRHLKNSPVTNEKGNSLGIVEGVFVRCGLQWEVSLRE